MDAVEPTSRFSNSPTTNSSVSFMSVCYGFNVNLVSFRWSKANLCVWVSLDHLIYCMSLSESSIYICGSWSDWLVVSSQFKLQSLTVATKHTSVIQTVSDRHLNCKLYYMPTYWVSSELMKLHLYLVISASKVNSSSKRNKWQTSFKETVIGFCLFCSTSAINNSFRNLFQSPITSIILHMKISKNNKQTLMTSSGSGPVACLLNTSLTESLR